MPRIGLIELRISRKQMGTGSISTQPRKFGGQLGKLRENRVMVSFHAANQRRPIQHGLGRVPTSWQAMPTSGNPGVYSDTPLQADARVIVLKNTAVGSAEILVR